MDIKFIGKFKELKPMGFTFHKLFANNYKVYEKNKVWIWVHRGGYVEIDHHFDNSGYIAKMILDGTYPVYTKDKDYKFFTIKKGKPRPCTIHTKTGEITETIKLILSYGNHDNFVDHPDYENYRDVSLLKDTMDTVLEIKDMIRIIE
jgi:hypothetical protein